MGDAVEARFGTGERELWLANDPTPTLTLTLTPTPLVTLTLTSARTGTQPKS